MKLTVIFRDDSPMIFCNDSPFYRSVQIELTKQQNEMLKPLQTGTNGLNKIYESISKCFIEPAPVPTTSASPHSGEHRCRSQ
jgi:hypothetical protein